MDFDVTELIRTLGSLASISSGYLNVKKAIVDSSPAKRNIEGGSSNTLTTEEKKSILQMRIQASSVSPSDEEALQVISPEILANATSRMRAAKDRYARVIMIGNISEIDEEHAITRTEVCFFLSIILEHNGGRFPTSGRLEHIWQEFRCTSLYPKFGLRSSQFLS